MINKIILKNPDTFRVIEITHEGLAYFGKMMQCSSSGSCSYMIYEIGSADETVESIIESMNNGFFVYDENSKRTSSITNIVRLVQNLNDSRRYNI